MNSGATSQPSAVEPATLVLASASPRRRELLEQVGLTPRIRPASIDERLVAGETPRDLVSRLAVEKCVAAGEMSDAREIVLAADTVIDRDGEVLGKPADEEDAVLMLLSLSGRRHEVHSGVCVRHVARGFAEWIVVTTKVQFADITLAEARRYAASGEPLGKAGAYAIQGRGARFVAGIEGSYSNVVGLPLFETLPLLEAAGLNLP
ncbi:MAG: hypothetical protein CSB44_05040 [Gammaproteobacteria bacterium]|nr:MAG: hypothetical protein CSB44_05040 [Gammaproteobacteria bacterium]PIE37113.1 MAG: hypothetical protein CSA54_02105 [Gammaproteobacteria bacterium]